jgi:hypothetical protein
LQHGLLPVARRAAQRSAAVRLLDRTGARFLGLCVLSSPPRRRPHPLAPLSFPAPAARLAPRSRYRHFVWLNSGVRGPFLPAYLSGRLHWARPLTDKLSAGVKLVGATINCGRAWGTDPYPHVQSYVVATDATGLAVLQAAPGVFDTCHPDLLSVVVHSEIGGSRAVLDAGYNLDCLLTRYQGLDWRDPGLAGAGGACNAGFNPLLPGSHDGVDLEPLEALFVKVKGVQLEVGWPSARSAVARARWARAARAPAPEARAAARRNEWAGEGGGAERAVAAARARGPACFDSDFYIRASKADLGFMRLEPDPHQEAWLHFLEHGSKEGRPHRWRC